MKYVEIKTAHNVIILHELSTWGERLLAFVIDWLIIGVIAFFVSIIANAAGSDLLIKLIIVPLIFIYDLFFEIMMNGQTPGKKALKIRVVNADGTTLRHSDIFMRWVFRVIDITSSFGIVATIMISSSDKRQRIGDLLAGTVIVGISKTGKVSLKELLKMKNQEYEATYPQVTMFTDEDMMLVKRGVERHRQFKNKAHSEFIEEVANKAAAKMGIETRPKKTLPFLKTLLNDYIYLTRT